MLEIKEVLETESGSDGRRTGGLRGTWDSTARRWDGICRRLRRAGAGDATGG